MAVKVWLERLGGWLLATGVALRWWIYGRHRRPQDRPPDVED